MPEYKEIVGGILPVGIPFLRVLCGLCVKSPHTNLVKHVKKLKRICG